MSPVPRRRGPIGAGAVVAAVIVLGACAASTTTVLQPPGSTPDSTAVSGEIGASGAPGSGSPVTTTTHAPHPPAPNGRVRPRTPATAGELVDSIILTERALRDRLTPAEERPQLGLANQIAYRTLGGHPEWDTFVDSAIPADLVPVVNANRTARRAFIDMASPPAETVPAWQIIQPASADDLLSYYRDAEAATGIGWEYLAAINLVETGYGRISGLSTANAIGPMQFLQSTWDEPGIGAGDIRNPRDAVAGAARYLTRRGGPADMHKALFGYNNHDEYVDAVTAYAQAFAADEATFRVTYEWEIFYSCALGDLWLPTGYNQPTTISATTYLATAPWSAP